MGVDRRYHRPPGLTLSWIGDALRAGAQDIGVRVPLDDADLTVLRLEQPRRDTRDYVAFGPFQFDRHQYDDALRALSAAIGSDVDDTRA